MMVLNHALTLSVTWPGAAAAAPDDTALQSGLPGNTVPLGTAMDTASALQAGVVSNPSPNPIQRSSTSSGGTGWNDADLRCARVSAHTGSAPAAPVSPVARLSS